MLLFNLLQTQSIDIFVIIEKYGFATFIALAGVFFCWQVWKYSVRKIDEKDVLIAEHKERRAEFDTRLIDTQNRIQGSIEKSNETQEKIVATIDKCVDIGHETRILIQNK